jgi:hypothetical protein
MRNPINVDTVFLGNLRRGREAYEAASRERNRIQHDMAQPSKELYNQVKIGGNLSAQSMFKVSELTAAIKDMEEDPSLRFIKILNESVGKNRVYNDNDGLIHKRLLKKLESKLIKAVEDEAYNLKKDISYLSRTFHSFRLKTEHPTGKAYLIASHSLDGIAAIFGGTYRSRAADGAHSATLVLSGPKGQNTPCFLYGDQKVDEVKFGIIYDQDRIDLRQGDFHARGSLGQLSTENVSKMGARVYNDSAEATILESKFSSKQGFLREFSTAAGKKIRVFITDHSKWNSRDKTWDGNSTPESRLRTYIDNVFLRYYTPAHQRFREEFHTEAEYNYQLNAIKGRGNARLGGVGEPQYNEALLKELTNQITGRPYEMKEVVKSIFIDVSNSKNMTQAQALELSALLKNPKNRPDLKLSLYNNKKAKNIMEEFDKETAISCLEEFCNSGRGSIDVEQTLIANLRSKSLVKTKTMITNLDNICGKGALRVGDGDITVTRQDPQDSSVVHCTYDIKYNQQGSEATYRILKDKVSCYEMGKDGIKKEIFTHISTAENDDILRKLIHEGSQSLIHAPLPLAVSNAPLPAPPPLPARNKAQLNRPTGDGSGGSPLMRRAKRLHAADAERNSPSSIISGVEAKKGVSVTEISIKAPILQFVIKTILIQAGIKIPKIDQAIERVIASSGIEGAPTTKHSKNIFKKKKSETPTPFSLNEDGCDKIKNALLTDLRSSKGTLTEREGKEISTLSLTSISEKFDFLFPKKPEVER